MGKVLLAMVLVLFAGTARCYHADVSGAVAGLPVVGAIVSPPPAAPAYVKAMGTPSANALPETDMTKWFAPGQADPYDVPTWQAIGAYAVAAGNNAGWAEVCKKATAAAGADRTTEPLLGALACSADGTVTGLQRFAVQLLSMRASVALWVKGVPGASIAAIQARQGEIRVACAVDVVARQGGSDGPFGQACAKALETAYATGDAAATFTALGEAYAQVATEIARLDPKTASEPGYFEAKK